MNLNKQTGTPQGPQDSEGLEAGPDIAGDLVAVIKDIAECIGNVIPHPLAIVIPGEAPRTCSTDNFPANRLTQIQDCFERNTQFLPGLMQVSDRLSEPYRFSDGSCAFLIPLVHDGRLESVLCLYDSGNPEQELHHQHLMALEPICRLAATFISSVRKTEAEAQLASSLLRTVSHDIRTPITTVRGFTKMILDGRTGPVSDSQRECLQMALNGVDQLIGTAASVSAASDLIKGIHPEVLDFRDLWQTAIKAAHPQLAVKAVAFEEDIDAERGLICGDRRALANVVERLLACVVRNVEYQGRLRVEVRCRNEMKLMLALPGLPSLPGADEDLADIREIVFLHGGQVMFRPGKDGGQTLTLTLPRWSQSTP